MEGRNLSQILVLKPFASEEKGDTTVVTSRLVGNFPRSPINLRFFFRLECGKIASLEIVP
jgi:hypothetical protein